MNIKELNEQISNIKKELIEFEKNLRNCDELNEETFKFIISDYSCAYDDLTRIRDTITEEIMSLQ